MSLPGNVARVVRILFQLSYERHTWTCRGVTVPLSQRLLRPRWRPAVRLSCATVSGRGAPSPPIAL